MANSSKNTVTTITFSKKTISLIVAAVGALLIFIGLFGDVLVAVVKQYGIEVSRGSVGLKWIFKDGWDAIYEGGGAGFQKFTLVLSIISFFVALIGVTFTIGLNIYKIVKKDDINFKFSAALLLASSLIYLCVIRATQVSGLKMTRTGSLPIMATSIGLGWGTILIIIGFIIALVGLIINESESEKISSQSNIALKSGVLFTYFTAIFGITTLMNYSVSATSSGVTSKESADLNVFSWLTEILENESTTTFENIGTVKALAVISLIFSLLSIIAFILLVYSFVRGELVGNRKKILLGSSITYLGTSLVANIMLLVSYMQFNKNQPMTGVTQSFNFGGAAIVSTVFGCLLVVAAIAAIKLDGRTVKFAKGK